MCSSLVCLGKVPVLGLCLQQASMARATTRTQRRNQQHRLQQHRKPQLRRASRQLVLPQVLLLQLELPQVLLLGASQLPSQGPGQHNPAGRTATIRLL